MKENNDNKNIPETPFSGDSGTENESNASRRIRALGLDRIEEEEGEPVQASRLENFWYHHKWKTVIISVFAVIALICTVQMLTKPKNDAYILYTGPQYMNADDINRFSSVLAEAVENDYNDDGKKIFILTDIVYLNDAQIEEKQKSEADIIVDLSANASAYEQFTQEMMIGNSVIYILDPALYEKTKGPDLFLTLAEVFGEDSVPESKYDEYGLRIGDTEFYKYFTDAQKIPADSIVAIRRVNEISSIKDKGKADEINKYHLEVFRAIAEFKYPDGYTPK